MLKVGITGSIGTGKTLASNFFKEKGYTVLDADLINQALLKDEKVIQEINHKLFDLESKVLDKKKVRELIFSNPKKKEVLESILHPTIYIKMEKALKKLEHDAIVFLDVPLLFEAEFDQLTDYNLVIFASKDHQIDRLIKRDSITKQEALLRIKAHFDIRQKMRLGDYVINNDESVENTLEQLNQWLENFKKVGQRFINRKKFEKYI